MKLKKPLLLLLTLALILCLPGTPRAAANYIGPRNRTTTTTSTQHLRVCYNSSGKIECTCVSDGGECDATSDPCPNGRCVSCDEQEKEVTNTTTLPNATVSANLSCATPGANGWCRGGQNLALSASEPVSGYRIQYIESNAGVLCDPADASSVSCNWTPPEGQTSLAFWAHSTFGDTSLQGNRTIFVDTGSPGINLSIPMPNGQNGWFISPVTATASASDAVSGVALTQLRLDSGAWQSGPLTVAAEGVHTLEAQSSDKAGNLANQSQTVRVDVTPPSLMPTYPPPDGQNGWYVTAPTVKVSGSDALSGLASAQVKVNDGAWVPDETTLNIDGNHTLTFQTNDIAGNISTQTAAFKVDLQGPILLLDGSGTLGQNGWFTSDSVAVASTASDTASGLSKVEARVDGGAWQSVSKVTVSGDGTHQVEFRATDNAGNVTQHAQTVQIDAAPPQIEVSIDGLAGLRDWFHSAANVSAKVVDETSDVAQLDIRVDGGDWQPVNAVKLEEDGIHQVEFRAVDKAGNQTQLTREVKIDQHDPIGQFVSPMGMTKVQGTVQVSGTVHDAMSGNIQTSLSINDGKTWQPVPVQADGRWSMPWDTLAFPGGKHAIQARFTDEAGNTSTAAIYYIVANALPKIDLTQRWYIWEKGLLEIRPGDLRLMDVTIDIADPQGRWPDVHFDYSPLQIPKEIAWNRKFGQILAPIGEYNVTVKVTDALAQQVEAHAVIVIPPAATPTVTQTRPATATFQASVTATRHPTATHTAVPTGTAMVLPTLVAVTPTPAPILSDATPWNFLFWLILLAGVGTLVAFAWSASHDPRPRELKQLGQAVSEISHADEL